MMLVFPRHACLKGNHWVELQSYNSPRICLTTNLMSKCQRHTILGKKSHHCLPSCSWLIPICSAKFPLTRSSTLSELTALHYCCMFSRDKPSRTKMMSLCVCAAPTNSGTYKVITKLGGGSHKDGMCRIF